MVFIPKWKITESISEIVGYISNAVELFQWFVQRSISTYQRNMPLLSSSSNVKHKQLFLPEFAPGSDNFKGMYVSLDQNDNFFWSSSI